MISTGSQPHPPPSPHHPAFARPRRLTPRSTSLLSRPSTPSATQAPSASCAVRRRPPHSPLPLRLSTFSFRAFRGQTNPFFTPVPPRQLVLSLSKDQPSASPDPSPAPRSSLPPPLPSSVHLFLPNETIFHFSAEPGVQFVSISPGVDSHSRRSCQGPTRQLPLGARGSRRSLS